MAEHGLDRLEVGAAGAGHADTLSSRNNLAVAYHDAGRTAEAIPFLEQTLADSELLQGTDHPFTIVVRGNLAALTNKPKRRWRR